MEQEEKVVPLESKTSNAVGQQTPETTKEPETAKNRRPETETAKNRRPETEIVTDQCKKAYAEKEAADHVVVEAVAIRPEVRVEIAKAETEMTGRPEEETASSSSSSSSSVDKALPAETSEKAPTSPDSKRDSALINPGIVAPVQPDVNAAEPETSRTATSGLGSKETVVRSQLQTKTRRSNSVESDKEISEILRNAPPPSVLSEEEEEEEEDKDEEGEEEIGTVVIMKKTFTESIKPGQEFKPIADEFCPPPTTTPSADPPCRLEHPVPSSTTASATTTTTGQPSNNNSNSSDGKVAADAAAAAVDSSSMETESKEESEDDRSRSILSKARNEARDLASELRRLQDFLENLSSFTELELASFHPDDSSSSTVTQTQILDSAQLSTTTHAAAAAAGVGEGDKNADILSSVDNV